MKSSKLILLFLVSVNAPLYPILMPGLMPGDFSPSRPRKRIKLEKPGVFYTYINQTLANLVSWFGFKSEPFPFDALPLDLKEVIIGLVVGSLDTDSASYSGEAQEELEEGIKDILSFSLTNKEHYALVHQYFKPKIQAIIQKKLMEHWKFKPVELAPAYGHSGFIMGALLYAGAYNKDRCVSFGTTPLAHSPLNYAIEKGYVTIIPHLLKAGVNPDYGQANHEGTIYSPLTWALFSLDGEKCIDAIRELLKHGADPRDATFSAHLETFELPAHEKRIIQMLVRIAKGDERIIVA